MEEAWTETEIPTVSYGALGRADEGSSAILTEALGENGAFRFLDLDRRSTLDAHPLTRSPAHPITRSTGLGIVSVTDIPGFSEMRQRLLPIAKRLASQPREVLVGLEDEASQYNVGWSFGRELLDGQVDTRKGSYYGNPNMDKPTEDEELVAKYPCYCRPNVWPAQDGCPEGLEGLEGAFKELGGLMYRVGMELLDACAGLVGEARFDPAQVSDPTCSRGRLLCYLPERGDDAGAAAAVASSPSSPSSPSSSSSTTRMWCGWHVDHGALTALCPAMYLDAADREVAGSTQTPASSSPSPSKPPGLYIRTRRGALLRASIRKDSLAFQVGEALEKISEGAFEATPHCVYASDSKDVTRCTMALFMQPRWDTVLGSSGLSFGDFSTQRLGAAYATQQDE